MNSSLWAGIIILAVGMVTLSIAKIILNKQKTKKLEEQLDSVKAENSRLYKFRQDAETSQRQLQSLMRQYKALDDVKNNLEVMLKAVQRSEGSAFSSSKFDFDEEADIQSRIELKEINQSLKDELEMLKLSSQQSAKSYQTTITKLQLQLDALQQEHLETSLDAYKNADSSLSSDKDSQSEVNSELLEDLEKENQKLTVINGKLLHIISLQKKKLEENGFNAKNPTIHLDPI